MPIALLSARRPSRPLPSQNRLDALFPGGRDRFDYDLPKKADAGGWDRFFRGADKVLHALQSFGARFGLGLWRPAAVAHATEWIVRHQDADGAWGGIQPPWIYSLMALHEEGYALTHPVIAKGLDGLNDPAWRWDEGEATFIGATNSPVWDTMLALLAFEDAGLSGEYPAEIEKAAEWLLSRQVKVKGDWSVKLPDVEPGGWPFEYANNGYPDIDDTAVALIALAPFRRPAEVQGAGHRRSFRPRRELAHRDAEPGRRLGRLRQGQRQENPHQNPVLRFRRGPRSAERRRDGACGGGLRQAWHLARASVDGPGDSLDEGRAGGGRAVVRPLGRQLCLWHGGGDAGAEGDRRGHARALYRARLRMAGRASTARAAAGAKAAPPTWTRNPPGAASPPPRRRPGR